MFYQKATPMTNSMTECVSGSFWFFGGRDGKLGVQRKMNHFSGSQHHRTVEFHHEEIIKSIQEIPLNCSNQPFAALNGTFIIWQ